MRYMDRDEIKALFAHLPREGRYALRDHAMLLVLYNTGARVQEVSDLRIEHVTLTSPAHVRLHGKGDKWRTCPLWDETVRVLRKLLEQRRPPDPTSPVFASDKGRPLTRFGIYKRVRQHAAAVESTATSPSTRITPHVFRSVSAWYPPFRDASFQRQFVLSTDRAWEFAAVVDGLDASLHGGPLQIDARDHPRGTRDDLRGGQHAVGDEVFDDRIADAELARGGLQRQPRSIVAVLGESPTISHVPDMMHAPRLALAGPVPQAIEDDGDRFVVADF